MSLSREALSGVAAKFVMAVGGFAGSVLFARVLSPSVFGGAYVLLRLSRMLSQPVNGWAIAGQKRLSEGGHSDSHIIGAQFLVVGGSVAVVGIFGFLFAEKLSNFIGIPGAALMLLIVFSSETTYQTAEQLLTGLGRVGLASWMDTVRSYLTLTAQVSLVLLGFGAGGIVYGVAVASILVTPYAFRNLKSNVVIPEKQTIQSLWAYARYSIVQNVLLTGYITGGILVLTWLYSTRIAGFYEIARIVATPAFMVSTVIGTGVLTKVSSRGREPAAVVEDIQNSLAFSSIVSIPLFLGAVALAREVTITVYGPEYAAAAPFLVLMTAFYVLWTQVEVLGQAINGLDRPKITVRILIIAFVVAFIVMVTGFRLMGPTAVVAALIAGEAIRYVGSVIYIRQEFPKFLPISRPQLEQVASAFVMFGTVSIAKPLILVRWWGDLLLLVGGGALVYFGVLLAISSQTRNTLIAAIQQL